MRWGRPLGLCPLSLQPRCPSHADLPRAPLSVRTGPRLMGTPAEALLRRAEVTSQGSRGWTRSGFLPALPHSSSTLLCPAWVPGAGLYGFANDSPVPPTRPGFGRWKALCGDVQAGRAGWNILCPALPQSRHPGRGLTSCRPGVVAPASHRAGCQALQRPTSRPMLSPCQLSVSAGVCPPCSGNSTDTILLANTTQ